MKKKETVENKLKLMEYLLKRVDEANAQIKRDLAMFDEIKAEIYAEMSPQVVTGMPERTLEDYPRTPMEGDIREMPPIPFICQPVHVRVLSSVPGEAKGFEHGEWT